MEAIFYLITFILIYFIYYYLILRKTNNLQDYQKSIEIKYLQIKFKIDFEKLNLKKVARLIAFFNTTIITFTLFLIQYIEIFVFKILIAFVILITLQLVVYSIFGKYLKRKCNNV